MSTKEELAREGLEAAFQSVVTKFKPGDYVATIKGVELIDSTRGISVAVKFEIDGQILPQYFGMLDRSGKPLKGGIVGVKLMLLALGYDLEQFSGESIERRLEEAFAEITEAQPEVRIRLSFKNEFQNIRVFEATGTEAE